MAEHTPRPWEFYITSAGTLTITAQDRQVVIATMGSVKPGWLKLEERIANGQLQAAAPELLAACEASEAEEDHFRNCDTCCEIWCDEMVGLHELAQAMRRNAITKARGKT